MWRRAAHLSFVGLCSYTVLGFSMMEAAMTVSQLGKDLSSCLHSSCMTHPHSPGPAAAASTSHGSLSKCSPTLPPIPHSQVLGVAQAGGSSWGLTQLHMGMCLLIIIMNNNNIILIICGSSAWVLAARLGVCTQKQPECLGGDTGLWLEQIKPEWFSSLLCAVLCSPLHGADGVCLQAGDTT